MAISIMRLPFILIIFSSSLFYVKATTHDDRHPRRPFNTIYAFGDSYTDTGNTRSNTGPNGFMFVSNLPYGRTFFHRPTNRYSDGRLVIDFVAQALSLPFLSPYLDQKADKSAGVNFAVAGSTAIIHSFFAKNNMTLNITPQSLRTQLNWFEQEIGANDYAYSFGSSVPTKTIQQLAINSFTGVLQRREIVALVITNCSDDRNFVWRDHPPPLGNIVPQSYSWSGQRQTG
ncbi:GDSL esterase/lipase [Sesamum angolense]|uniref:GDSL esterase/lipase n=1 Tax=Sesamum angolense TaxID=2727404 RepID=A0AAE1WM54_9LAMI|nr:GDSL esterase/lipase [Sesamum angolense]